MNLETQLLGLKKKLRRSINRQKKLLKLKNELTKLERESNNLQEILDGKLIENASLKQSSREVGNGKHIMQ